MSKIKDFFQSISDKFTSMFSEESRLVKWWDSCLERLPMELINRNKRRIIVIAVIVAVLLVCFFVGILRTYKNYSAKETYDLSDSSATSYAQFQNNLLKYNSDGAFYTTYSGDVIWNETFDMNNPSVDIYSNYLAIYDKGGTSIYLMNTTGRINKISTTMPIVKVCLAKKGTCGVLMQQADTGYLQMYDVDGDILASGELHLEESGYPLDIDLSEDAKQLAVSLLDVNTGTLKTTVSFYDFTSKGKKSKNNIVASHSFENMVIPQITYIEGGKLLAFGDTEAVIFSSSSKPKVKKEIAFSGNVESVFNNEKYFGAIYDGTDDDGKQVKKLCLYSANGFKRFDKEIDSSYTNCSMLKNNSIVLINQEKCDIYTLTGIKRFSYTFDSDLYNVFQSDGRKEFIFVRNGVLEDAHIK